MSGTFDGGGFSHEPIDGDEAAQFRHMFREISSDWKSIADTVSFFRALIIFFKIIKFGIPVALATGAFGVWITTKGIF